MATPFTLVPATPADIPALAQISARAFLTDTHTQLKGLVKKSTHAEWALSFLPLSSTHHPTNHPPVKWPTSSRCGLAPPRKLPS